MLRFKLQQLYVPSLGRYFLPLPKLAEHQIKLLSAHLEAEGFSIRPGSAPDRRMALMGNQRIYVEGRLGLARSSEDMLDALAPAIPALVASRRAGLAMARADVAAMYFSLKRSAAKVELQLFPRMESLRTWTCLRKDGLCGLTPDEAAALKLVLGGAPGTPLIECVTERPRAASKAFQIGRKLYYRSALPVSEFLSTLRYLGSEGAGQATYLPRDSVLRLPALTVDAHLSLDELGEWCCLG